MPLLCDVCHPDNRHDDKFVYQSCDSCSVVRACHETERPQEA